MSITRGITEVNRRELRETASSIINIRRAVNDDLSVVYPISVSYITTIFEINAEGAKTKKVGEEEHTTFELTSQEVLNFFTLPVTTAAGETTLGALIASLTDNLIQARLTPPVG